jgi:thiosulfate/3-mercaptopyruvate sulfurtransferase
MLKSAGNAVPSLTWIVLLMAILSPSLPGGILPEAREVKIAAAGAEAREVHDSQAQWSASQMMDPDQLAKVLSDAKRPKPVVLYIGPSILFRSGHIPSARYAGPAAQAPAIEELQRLLRSLRPDSEIVLYCGCCPWEHCPNIQPALGVIQKMGFKNARILHLPRSFKEDWTDRGFPTLREPVPVK